MNNLTVNLIPLVNTIFDHSEATGITAKQEKDFKNQKPMQPLRRTVADLLIMKKNGRNVGAKNLSPLPHVDLICCGNLISVGNLYQ
ncbi:MAG: hypothetical protein LBU34_01590 [Planctomycetaceae bacterium]|jgi:hypothetical protein|nr:hypothetical protein [Planctomycetaceae bacterium]